MAAGQVEGIGFAVVLEVAHPLGAILVTAQIRKVALQRVVARFSPPKQNRFDGRLNAL